MKTKNTQKGSLLAIGIFAVAAAAVVLPFLGFIKNQEQKINNLKQEQYYNQISQEAAIQEALEENIGAFRPSNYVGKLLTRLEEGGSETTFQTTPGTAKDGTSLTTAKIGDFIVLTINPGAANEEKISASAVSVSGTVATWSIINRGLSFTENVSLSNNKKSHAIGETVIISNDDHFLSTQYPSRDANETITGQWTFTNFPITASSSFASATSSGWVELATGQEAASSTLSGNITASRLALGTNLSTSTPPTSGHVIPVTGIDGNIPEGFIPTTLAQNYTFSGTVNFASSTTVRVYTTVGTTTWTKPANLSYVMVEVQGGGGGGDSTADDGGGGGAGGYARKLIRASLLGSTETVTVGNFGNAEQSGTLSSFTVASGTNVVGNAGSGSTSSSGGSGGTATGGDINISGQAGGNAFSIASVDAGGAGGNSVLGFGGQAFARADSTGGSDGMAGSGYGGGGAGAQGGSGSGTGGAGTQGIVIITEYFN